MTVFGHIRERLIARAGLTEPVQPKFTLAELEREWSLRFERLMRNRLMMGALRYGRINAPNKPQWNRVKGILKRLNQYEETGNLECLVDVANLALLEFEEGKHPKRHFDAEAMDGNHSCV